MFTLCIYWYSCQDFVFHREFSSRPHIAGSDRQQVLANKLVASWNTFGFDKVEKPEYKVLLSFPQPEKPNRVSLVENGSVIYETVGKIKVKPRIPLRIKRKRTCIWWTISRNRWGACGSSSHPLSPRSLHPPGTYKYAPSFMAISSIPNIVLNVAHRQSYIYEK